MVQNAKISVVTVCYNAADALRKTIASVAAQTYGNVEYIVVDGKSTDGTMEVINDNLSAISKYISEPDSGIYYAMNKAIDLSSGEWVIFMNAGDVFYSDTVIEQVFANGGYADNVGIVYGDVMLDFGEQGMLPKRYARLSGEEVPLSVCHQSVFTRLDILKKMKYDTSYRICADCNSFLQIYRQGYAFVYAPLLVSVFEVVDGISSKRNIAAYRERCRLLGTSPCSLKNLPATLKVYFKTALQSLMPRKLFTALRFRSVKSRKEYR